MARFFVLTVIVSSVGHHNFKVEESGLFISTEYPFVGASPDGLVTCACCSDGVCEIKVCSLTLILCIHTYSNHMTIYPMCSAHIVTKITLEGLLKTPTSA